MTTQQESPQSFRFSHDRARIAFGLIAAATAIVSAVVIFGPMADQKVMVMSGSSSRTDPSVAAASTPLRVASSEQRTGQ